MRSPTMRAVIVALLVILPTARVAAQSSDVDLIARAAGDKIVAFHTLDHRVTVTETGGLTRPGETKSRATMEAEARAYFAGSSWRFFRDGSFRFVSSRGSADAEGLSGTWSISANGSVTVSVRVEQTTTNSNYSWELDATVAVAADGRTMAAVATTAAENVAGVSMTGAGGRTEFEHRELDLLLRRVPGAGVPAIPAGPPSARAGKKTTTPSNQETPAGRAGGSYTSPTYGYKLRWAPPWQEIQRASQAEVDLLALANDRSTVLVIGGPDRGSARAEALSKAVTTIFDSAPDVTKLRRVDERHTTSTASATYHYVDRSTGVTMTVAAQLVPLVTGKSVLLAILETPTATEQTERAAFDQLLAGLRRPNGDRVPVLPLARQHADLASSPALDRARLSAGRTSMMRAA